MYRLGASLVWIPASTCCPLLFCTRCSFQRYPGCQSHVAMDTTKAIQQKTSHTKKFISRICLRPPYLQVCLPRRLHLLACVTSCLSHYLSVCISVCPPASAPPVRPQRDIIFFSREKTEETMAFFFFLHSSQAFLLGFYMLQYNIIPFIILMECFIFPLFHFSPLSPSLSRSPRLCSRFTGRQEGWRGAAVPQPKLTASEDERPPLIALPGLLLSNQSTSHQLRKCVHRTLQPRQLHSRATWQWWNYFGVCSKFNSWFCCVLSSLCSLFSKSKIM